MTIVQTNSLPLPLETFTQPCAEQRKSLVEQTEEITVELLLESNDIQLFGNKLRFLVAPLKIKQLQLFVTAFLFLWQMSLFVLHTKMQNRIKFDYRERRRSGLIVSYC